MTIEEAQQSFKQQSLKMTGHKNIILNSDYWSIFSGPQLTYKRIKTRSDRFIVKCISDDNAFRNDDDIIREIKIIKPIPSKSFEFTVKQVWKDYSEVINLLDPNSEWDTHECFLIKSLPENEIINLLENTIFTQYIEDYNSSSSTYQTVQLKTC
jgi:hypothetical protein